MKTPRKTYIGKPAALIRKELNEKTREELDRIVTRDTISKFVAQIVRNATESIVAAALGFKKRAYDKDWDFHSGDSDLYKKLRKKIQDALKSEIDTLLTDIDLVTIKEAKKQKVIATYRREYREQFDSMMRDHIDNLASKQAELDVQEMLSKITEEYKAPKFTGGSYDDDSD